ncbi:DUF1043 family protein [Reinekea marina]|uniref:Z-ring associated protein G n=1 Tax=Reinekea marina TaxID=1310421 RepID=A0ABV7WMR5_9GAMM|nr:DUF1043 family protein [Reinekea marina]MBU2864702.1 YhcB family protein [Reinekea forsetii]MDN3648747.1 DUF1043 family protein [Reinekea marina]
MLELQWSTLIAIIIAALIIGSLLGRIFLKRDGQDRSSLRKQLDELKQQHQNYEVSVTEHFGRTTELIEQLSQNYTQIEEHLNLGAEKFINPEYRLESARTGETSLEELTPHSGNESEEPAGPKDYAPKQPNQEGTLSETYGLKRSDFQEDPTESSSR